MTFNARKAVLHVHRWTGLTIGLVILMMALTGIVNLFRPSLEPVVDRELLTVPSCNERVPLDALAAGARAAHPRGTLDYIRLTAGEEDAARMPAARIRFADPPDDVYLNPCTGRVLGERARYGGLFGTVEQIHILRVSEDKWVRSITGVCAIVFGVVLIVGGIYMWWPRHGSLKTALALNTRLTGRAWHLNLHRSAGLYASLILLTLILTGLPLAFDSYRDAIYWMTGSALPPKASKSSVQAGAGRLSMEEFWQRAQALSPQPADALLKFPSSNPDAALEGFLIEKGAPHPNARTLVSLDAYSGKVLRHTPYAASSPGHKLYFWTISFHTGEVGGVPGQVALLAGTLAVPVMAYTGFASFLRRRRAPVRTTAPTIDVRLTRVQEEAIDIKSFELASASGMPLPCFTAGAHIDVHVEDGLVRQYSLCNDPSERGRYLIAVKRDAESRGGSRAMHERVDQGDVLTISAPKNHFPIDRAASHHVLLASGIGITPLICMAEHLLARQASFELHYFARSIDHTAFHGQLSEPRFAGKVSFHYAVEPERLREMLHRLLGRRAEGAHLYLCGSKRFIRVVEELTAAHWPPERVHTEYFNADPMASAGERKPFEITLARSGGTFTVPSGKSIVDVLKGEAICEVTTSCEQGVCGTCLTGVLSGTPDHRDVFLSEAERRAGQKMILCVSRAKSERLVLDL
jgi:ferredoxin-NADP reductase